jgi:hypothetical protein
MTDARSKQPDKLDVDLKRLGIGDPYVAIIESWTYFGIKNEDVFPRELTVRFQAGGFAEAGAKARTLAETINIAHDIHKTNVRLVCEEPRFDAMTKADKARKPADFSEKAPTVKATDLGFPFQHRVRDWVLACFGEVIAADVTERNHRFLEEALELVQAKGCTNMSSRVPLAIRTRKSAASWSRWRRYANPAGSTWFRLAKPNWRASGRRSKRSAPSKRRSQSIPPCQPPSIFQPTSGDLSWRRGTR